MGTPSSATALVSSFSVLLSFSPALSLPHLICSPSLRPIPCRHLSTCHLASPPLAIPPLALLPLSACRLASPSRLTSPRIPLLISSAALLALQIAYLAKLVALPKCQRLYHAD